MADKNCEVPVDSTCLSGPKGIAVPPNFCSKYFATKGQTFSPRSVVTTESGDVLVLDRGRSPPAIVSLHDDDNNGVAESLSIIAEMDGLNHGLVVYKNFVYASSDTTVWRWPYKANQRVKSTSKEVVVKNINANGQGGAPMGHKTRTLIFDKKDYLYVSVGSVGNVDVDDYRSRIRRFRISPSTSISNGGFEFDNGEVFANGLRNEVGLAFDKYDVLYGVENGADNLNRQDLGGDIHNENPAEELNRFPVENLGKHYGYPFCWTEYSLPKTVGKGKGTIWAWPSTMATKNDQWCRENTIKPVLSMQAHSAPLGITFFNYSNVGENSEICPGGGSFPKSMDGDAFIAFHGSWNRNPPTGYKVVRVPFGNDGNPTVDEPIDFLCHRDASNNGAKWPDGFRPVDVAFDKCNRLLVTSDGTGGSKSGASVVLVSYNGGGGSTNTSPSPSSNDSELKCKLCNDDGQPDMLLTIIIIAVVSVCLCFGAIAVYILYKRRKKNKAGDNTNVEVDEKKSPLTSG